MIHIPLPVACAVAFLAALVIALMAIPRIIYVSKKKRLLDLPDNHRKLHVRVVPNLGGVAIFFAYIIVTSLAIQPGIFTKWNYIAAATLLLFVTGLKDDLVNVNPPKKFLAQATAAFIVAYFADIRVESLHGILGIYTLPHWASIAFTVVGCTFVTNAFNLIDGIDGLAGSIGALASATLGLFFAVSGRLSEASMAFALAGAIVGFLRHNWAPASIFMGDTGALVIGFTVSVLCVTLVNLPADAALSGVGMLPRPHSGFIVALAVLFIPVFDTFRVFTMRLLKRRSPFAADRTHVHHYLLDCGLSHAATVAVIVGANGGIVALAIALQAYNVNAAIALLLCVGVVAFAIVFAMRRWKADGSAAHSTQGLEGRRTLAAPALGYLLGRVVTRRTAAQALPARPAVSMPGAEYAPETEGVLEEAS